MSKVIDITDKLNFEEKPVILIQGKEITVNNEAVTVLKLMDLMGDGVNVTPKAMAEMAKLLFTEEGHEALASLGLSFDDYSKVIEEAMNLVVGDDGQGEAESATMTSSKTGT